MRDSTARPSGTGAERVECEAEALRKLARRERTRRNLATTLRRRFSEGVVTSVVAELAARGLVDDRRFATLFVERAVRLKPQSARALEARLRKEGCDAEIAREVLREARVAVEGFDEISLARRLIEKKLRIGVQDRAKILGAMARQGFSRSVAMDAWAAVAKEEGDRVDR